LRQRLFWTWEGGEWRRVSGKTIISIRRRGGKYRRIGGSVELACPRAHTFARSEDGLSFDLRFSRCSARAQLVFQQGFNVVNQVCAGLRLLKASPVVSGPVSGYSSLP